MSKETYCAKYSQDCGDYFKALQTPDERAERMLASKKQVLIKYLLINKP